MVEVKGKYCTAKVFTNNLSEETVKQIKLLFDQQFVKGMKV